MRAFTALLVLLLVLPLSGCGGEKRLYKTQGHVFGTVVEVSIYGETQQQADALSSQVLKEFDRLHHKLHAWQPSMLTALNDAIARGQPFEADEEMVQLLKGAAALSARSDDLFNPAIGHLIRLWGFQSSDIHDLAPDPAEIRRWVKANPRLSDLRYEGTVIRSVNPAVMIDLGGYAKGYALDRAAAILRAAHVEAALINVGGNVLAIGQPGGQPWRVGIRDPRGEAMLAKVALHDNEAIGTSGDYERYFMKNAKRHPHMIDPRSGETIDLVASVTVVASGGSDPGLRSDGNSKPLFITGPEGWEVMAHRLGLKEVMLVDAHHRVFLTPAMRERMDAGLPQ